MTISLASSTRRQLAYALALGVAVTATVLPMSMGSASAADFPVQPRPAAIAAPNWTGFYIGAHGGWGLARTTLQDPTFSIAYEEVVFNSDGWLGGGQVGANWQFGRIVVGGELEASAAALEGTIARDPRFRNSGFITNVRALATGTGRVGYDAGGYLGYIKGGVAWANIEFTNAIDSPQPQVLDLSRTGLVGGAGLEAMLTSNLSARVEYNFVYFGPTALGLSMTLRGSQDVEHQLHLVKAGLNWRFNGDYLFAR